MLCRHVNIINKAYVSGDDERVNLGSVMDKDTNWRAFLERAVMFTRLHRPQERAQGAHFHGTWCFEEDIPLSVIHWDMFTVNSTRRQNQIRRGNTISHCVPAWSQLLRRVPLWRCVQGGGAGRQTNECERRSSRICSVGVNGITTPSVFGWTWTGKASVDRLLWQVDGTLPSMVGTDGVGLPLQLRQRAQFLTFP